MELPHQYMTFLQKMTNSRLPTYVGTLYLAIDNGGGKLVPTA
jgi:hypothetical protein